MLIIIGVLLFELIVLIHEGGHFVSAKLSGVKVNEFALGMGPKLFSFTKGETKYSLRLLPIGGFCSMEGEDEDSDDPRAFGNKAVWKRIIIVAAGAVMNIVLGLVMTLILVLQQPFYASTTIAAFDDNSVTSNSIQIGDRLEEIDGYAIWNARDITFALGTCQSFSPDIKVNRNGQSIDLGNVPLATYDNNGTKQIVRDFYVERVDKNFFSVCGETIGQTVSTVRMVWASLIGLVTGKFGFNDMSGPVGVASAVTTVASAGLESSFLDAFNNILNVMMIITINLGIFNLLPIPALDGGRLFFLLIELIRRKPIPQKYEGAIHAAGFALLMVFMLAVTFNDIMRIVTGSGFG
ncbi:MULTISPECIES: RIP metalloprotease [unclassified Ruminococcus]|uniref:M50 family metallopeptidase n=1 Tax=unclassified Ruminococcus TaxID=2608920 RepID=UPI00210D8E5B|nr:MULTISPECIES: site-2 protease family protein [unclassified Ruminococcus]